ncbi:FtsB family cell division protein [Robertkochia aurantiaca]|uniref:FtsB family cell division protein n=1 Tax=Robertkochia aurantiaca TaxID=2873700 RepID=UPI001CCCA7C4|nr:septum formation initiator family protein [Robertkochia sp. 3YJGBD-33]
MNLKSLRKSKWFKYLGNIYVLITTVFVVWMLFFDTNSWWFTHRELDNEIEKLRKQKEHLKKEIDKDKAILRKLQDQVELEKFAREEYYLKKDNEEIFIIQYEDSLKNN